jgi:hypothetical protein
MKLMAKADSNVQFRMYNVECKMKILKQVQDDKTILAE